MMRVALREVIAIVTICAEFGALRCSRRVVSVQSGASDMHGMSLPPERRTIWGEYEGFYALPQAASTPASARRRPNPSGTRNS